MPFTTAWREAASNEFNALMRADGSGRIQAESGTRRIVLFRDPDTLRGDGRAEWGPMRNAIRALEDRGVAIVLFGDETRSQLEVIQRDLDLQHPFISEAGGGLFVPHGYFPEPPVGGRNLPNYRVVDFGKPYYQVAEALHEVARKLGADVVAFSDMSIQDVARDCALSLSQARLAKLREYDEPFRMFNSDPATLSRLCSALWRLGFRCFTHETFHHATGVAGKTQSIRFLTALYRGATDGPVLTVGLAKAESEARLLQTVDIAFIVGSDTADAARLGLQVPTARFTSTDGPQGWCNAVLHLVDSQVNAR
jgi:mannosyl-3-phosphoglycerate phosphatase